MKGKDIAITALVIVSGVFLLLFFLESEDNKKLREKNDDLQEDKLKLLKDRIDNAPEISTELKNQIQKLIKFYNTSHPSVSKELKDVLIEIQNGQDVKAIRDLAKIIENLLKAKYKSEERFCNAKHIPLKHLIEYAKEKCFFNEKQHKAACILHDFRNQESHELAVDDTENMKMMALLGGIELIFLFKSA